LSKQNAFAAIIEIPGMVETRLVTKADGTGEVYLEEEPVGSLEGSVLVDVEASLISAGSQATSVQEQRENPDPSADPWPLGYQNAGTVVETGATVDRFEPGDRVACLGSGDAVHADYAVVPVNLCVTLPDDVSYEAGAFANFLGTALHATRRAELQLGENVIVAGLGPVGQLTGQFASIAGCHVIGSDLLDSRMRTAADVGFEAVVDPGTADLAEVSREFSDGYGLDSAFLCFGGQGTDAFESLHGTLKVSPDGHTMGQVVVVGGTTITQTFSASLGNVDIINTARTGPGYHDHEYERGASYPPVFVEWDTRRNLDEALRLISTGELDVASLVTDRYSLDDAAAAYDQLIQNPDESLGVIIAGS
jgi:threonine dehydrogenase-like Zn-dependent dehydrogenase